MSARSVTAAVPGPAPPVDVAEVPSRVRRRSALGVAAAGAVALAGAGAAGGADAWRLAVLALGGAALGAVALHDLRDRRIPNRIVLPAAAACLPIALVAGDRLALAAGLAVVAGLLTFSLALPHAFGMGDVKLALLVVTALGAEALPALALAAALAGLWGVAALLRRGRSALVATLPLAPFVAVSVLLEVVLRASGG